MRPRSCERTAFAIDQRGIALVVSLVMMLVLVVLGYGLLVATDGSTRAETGLKAQMSAFEVADAGIEFAREKLRQCIAGTPLTFAPCNTAGGTTLQPILDSYRNGHALVDSTSLAGFGSTTGTTNGTNPSNTPFVASDTTSLAPSAFQVFITNDPFDDVTVYTTDSNQRVTLTSFASGPNGIGFAVLQAVVEVPLFKLQTEDPFRATLVLPGPNLNLLGWTSSNNYGIANTAPNCAATIGVTSNAARYAIVTAVSGPPDRTGKYTTCWNGGGSDPNYGIYDFLPQSLNPYQTAAPSPPLPTGLPAADQNVILVSYYQKLLQKLSAIATFHETDVGSSTFTLGTTTSPQIVYINGDYVMGPGTGAGILVVTGNLTIHGNPTYNGLILAVGAGSITFSGGGNGNFTGTVVAANTAIPWATDTRYVGIPTINLNGGGNSGWGFGGATGESNIPFTAFASPHRLSFARLR